MKLRIVISLFAGALLLLNACGESNSQMRRGAQSVVPYPVLNLEPQAITLESTYPATLKGIQTVEIRPRVSGYIIEIPVEEGSIVEKGQTLFRLSDDQYQQQIRSAEADIQAAKAGVNVAKNEIQRLSPLAEKGIISEYELKSAKLNLQTQQANLAQAQAALQNAKIDLSYTNVKSPTDGVLGNITYRVGSLVSSTIAEPLTVVSNISGVFAYFSMSERELLEMTLATAEEGNNETLQELISEMPEVNFIMANNLLYDRKGTLELASGLINTQTGSAFFRAVFPNPQQILRDGGTGTVQIPVHLDSVIVVPKSSTYEIQELRFVYTVTDSNTVESIEIQTLQNSTERLFVVESGLSAGSTIVTTGMGRLQDGAEIEPNPVNADSLYEALK